MHIISMLIKSIKSLICIKDLNINTALICFGVSTK